MYCSIEYDQIKRVLFASHLYLFHVFWLQLCIFTTFSIDILFHWLIRLANGWLLQSSLNWFTKLVRQKCFEQSGQAYAVVSSLHVWHTGNMYQSQQKLRKKSVLLSTHNGLHFLVCYWDQKNNFFSRLTYNSRFKIWF